MAWCVVYDHAFSCIYGHLWHMVNTVTRRLHLLFGQVGQRKTAARGLHPFACQMIIRLFGTLIELCPILRKRIVLGRVISVSSSNSEILPGRMSSPTSANCSSISRRTAIISTSFAVHNSATEEYGSPEEKPTYLLLLSALLKMACTRFKIINTFKRIFIVSKSVLF